MWHRKLTYMRLDGSSKISERRDMVADFQSRYVPLYIHTCFTINSDMTLSFKTSDSLFFNSLNALKGFSNKIPPTCMFSVMVVAVRYFSKQELSISLFQKSK